MYPLDEQPVPSGEHAVMPSPKDLPDWEGARLFLEIVRRGSFRAASEHLGQSVNALRRRIGEFERTLGVTLLIRDVDGVRPTAEGDRILVAARSMEQAAFDLVRARDQTNQGATGEVRLAVTEGLGTFWIAPRLVEFQRANPQLIVDVNCAMRSADVLRHEADVAVQLTKPVAQDLRVVKLGRLHMVPFAAQSYLDTYGTPTSLLELINHRVVVQVGEQAIWQQLYNELFPHVPPGQVVTLRNNVSSAHYWSIAKGAGIGLLPTYAHALGAGLVPIDFPVHIPLDIWLTYHADAAHIPRVRRLIDWLVQSFSPRKFPWFRDEFVLPQQLSDAYKGESLVNLFAGFNGTAMPPG
jgi:DNA-binding transcriptional LysR family regulator